MRMTTTTLAGTKIRRFRETHSLSLDAFGERFGVPKPTVAGWETEGKRARQKAANRLAEAGVVEHADWFQPGQCLRCSEAVDSKAVAVCNTVDCPLRARRLD